MRKLTDFVFIDKYCIPIDQIRWIEERDNDLEIHIEYLAFPLIIKNYSINDLIKGFKQILGDNENEKD